MFGEELKETEDTGNELQDHLVAFLDILGFKEIIENYGGENSILNAINVALKGATSNIYIKEQEKMDLNLKFNQFSDCTCISIYHHSISDFKTDELVLVIRIMLSILSYFQIHMMNSNFYIRGGLSIGFHFENEHMIFSEGLIKSHYLESKKAEYPRIILDDKLLKILKKLFEDYKSTMLLYSIDQVILSDWDGVVFINPFIPGKEMERLTLKQNLGTMDDNSPRANGIKKMLEDTDRTFQINMLNNVENQIKECKEREKDYTILKKYIWLKELIKWNQDPNSSKIKFEYFLK